MYCLDTSFLIDLSRRKADAIKKYWQISGSRLYTSAVNVYEFLCGTFTTKREEQEALRFISAIDVLDFNRVAAHEAAEITKQLRATGKNVDGFDILVAAVAKTNHLKVIARDRDFHKIPGLEVEEY